MLCSPSNEKLFTEYYDQDKLKIKPCKPITEDTIEAKEIIIPETSEKYYYNDKDGNITIFKYNETLESFVELDIISEEYQNIKDRIIDST